MKIVQINAVYQYSSTGRNVSETHRFLQDRGIDSHVFCTNWVDPVNAVYRIGNLLDHKLHALFSRLFGLQAYFSYFPTKSLLRRLDRIRPDVVLLHNLHGNYIHLPLLLKYLGEKDIPTVVVLHDCWFFTGHCCHYTEDHCQKWQHECYACPILHKYNRSLFFDHSRKIFRDKQRLFAGIPRLGVVGVSDWITGEARKSPILGQARLITRIYNWIDLSIFHPKDTTVLRQTLDIGRATVILGVAQTWSEAKGLSHFIQVAKNFPNDKVILVGHLPSGTDLPANVLAVGVLSDVHQLADYYALADVFLNTSIQETFGKVAAEALACGTPLIVNDATANLELVGDCGFVIHNNNDSEIADAIFRLKTMDLDSLSRRCVERANSLFEKNKNLNLYLEVMEQKAQHLPVSDKV